MSSASSWGCELKYIPLPLESGTQSSASSWGCELKWAAIPNTIPEPRSQPLREAVSWNAFLLLSSTGFWSVSLFVRLWVEIKLVYLIWMEQLRQPLREAVSWNNVDETWLRTGDVSLFVRLWVEMLIAIIFTSSGFVSLFVRLWVEILEIQLFESESNVSLFVRLWVEITMGC